jgi:hypothetical protein
MNTIDTDCRADLRRIYRDIESPPLPRRALVVCQPEASETARQAFADLVDRGEVRIILDRPIVFG